MQPPSDRSPLATLMRCVLSLAMCACSAGVETPDAAADGSAMRDPSDAEVPVDTTTRPDTSVPPIVDGGQAPDTGWPDAATDASEPTPESPGLYQNPVLDESGDPFCGHFGDAYYLYLPQTVRRGGVPIGGRVIAFTSTDLVHWTRVGSVYDNVDDAYGGGRSRGLWAPEVLSHGGHYYLYYASVMSNPLDPRVGDKDIIVIRSDDPTDFHGGERTVLLDGDYAFIDPSPFQDPATGELYLLYKVRGAYGTGTLIRIRPLATPTRFSGAATRLLSSDDVPDDYNILEHPMMAARDGQYFLIFSKGQGDGTTYQIAYATSDAPTGTFTQRGTLFQSHLDRPAGQRIISPGAPSIVTDGAGEAWMVYRQKTTTATTFADRAVSVDRIRFHPARHEIAGTPSHGELRDAPAPLP